MGQDYIQVIIAPGEPFFLARALESQWEIAATTVLRFHEAWHGDLLTFWTRWDPSQYNLINGVKWGPNIYKWPKVNG